MTIHYRIVDLGDLENPRYIGRCVEWMAERYRIHLKKDVEQLPPPWTTQRGFDIRYCNVKREMDRESRALIASTCSNPDLTLEEKMLNCIIFRLVNKHISYTELGFPRKLGLLSQDEINQIETRVMQFLAKNPDYVPWTAAYMVGGAIRGMKSLIPEGCEIKHSLTALLHIWNRLQTEYNVKDALRFDTAQSCLDYMEEQHYPGCSRFLTYQVFLDWTYCPDFPFSEDDGVFSGPGCDGGLWRVYCGDTCTKNEFLYTVKHLGLTPEDLLRIIRRNSERYFKECGIELKELLSDLPEEKRYFTLANWENTMCEFQKYWRYLNERTDRSRGKKKRYYPFEEWHRANAPAGTGDLSSLFE